MNKASNRLHLFKELYTSLKWALLMLKEYRFRLYLYVAILLIQTVFELYISYRIGNIVDYAVMDDMTKLISTGIFFVGLYVVNAILSIVSNRFAARNYNGMYNSLELKVYRKLMDASWEELTEYHSGDIITRLGSDIKNVAGNTSGLVPTIISKTVFIIVAAAMVIYFDFSMLLLAVIIGPVILLASRIFMGKIYTQQMLIREVESRITSYNKETFNNIQAIKAFGLGNVFYEKMNDLEKHRLEVDLKSNKYSLCSWGLSFGSGIFGGAVCITWTFYRVHSGIISFGILVVLVALAIQIGQAVKVLLNLIPTMMEYVASSNRIKSLIELNDEEIDKADTLTDSFKENAITQGLTVDINNMQFSYRNGYQVFENANVLANPGEIIALVGPSGEGKTTMLRIILGIVKAKQGTVKARTAGEEVNFGSSTRELISYVPQGNTMMAGSIADNMRLIKADASDEEIIEALKTACIYDFVAKLDNGINHVLGENGLGFSEGQNQRLSIARALIKDTPVLLMDEATSALDVATERKVLNNIMVKTPNRTCILTTHRPSVLSMCDRVYRIANKETKVLDQNGIDELIDEF